MGDFKKYIYVYIYFINILGRKSFSKVIRVQGDFLVLGSEGLEKHVFVSSGSKSRSCIASDTSRL